MVSDFNFPDSTNDGVQVRSVKHARTPMQISLISKVFLATFFLFLVVAALTYGIVYAFQINRTWVNENVKAATIIAVLAAIVSCFLPIVINIKSLKMTRRSATVNGILLGFYTVLVGTSLGIFLGILAQLLPRTFNFNQIPVIFLIAAFAIGLMSVVGYFMRNKAAVTLSKILVVGWIATLLFALTCSLFFYFLLPSAYNWIYFVYCVVGSLLILGSVSFTVWSMRKTEEELLQNGKDPIQMRNFVILYTTALLVSLISLVWYLIRLMLLFSRN